MITWPLIEFAYQHKLPVSDDTVWGNNRGFDFSIKRERLHRTTITIYTSTKHLGEKSFLSLADSCKFSLHISENEISFSFVYLDFTNGKMNVLSFIDSITKILHECKCTSIQQNLQDTEILSDKRYLALKRNRNSKYILGLVYICVFFILEKLTGSLLINQSIMKDRLHFMLPLMLGGVFTFLFYLIFLKRKGAIYEALCMSRSANSLYIVLLFIFLCHSYLSLLIIEFTNCYFDDFKTFRETTLLVDKKDDDHCYWLKEIDQERDLICSDLLHLHEGQVIKATTGNGFFGINWIREIHTIN